MRIDSQNSSDEEDIIAKKKVNKGKEKKTYVFEIELTEYTNDSYAEYNWKDLVQKEEDKDRDSDIEIIEIDINDSQSKPKFKKSSKPVDPEDEYDLDDDFIDDTEVNDEEVPDEVSTACGGFYINTGSLKFKYKDGISKPVKDVSQEEKDKLLAGSNNQIQESSIKNYFGSSMIPKKTLLPQVSGKRSNGTAH